MLNKFQLQIPAKISNMPAVIELHDWRSFSIQD